MKNTTKETSDTTTSQTVPSINPSLTESSALSAKTQNLFSTSWLDSALTVPKTKSQIQLSGSAPGNLITLIFHLLKTGPNMEPQCLFLRNSWFLARHKSLITTAKCAKFVLCQSIGASKRMHVFSVHLEQYLMWMIRNVKSLKLTTWRFFKALDGWLTIVTWPGSLRKE